MKVSVKEENLPAVLFGVFVFGLVVGVLLCAAVLSLRP